MKNIFFLLLVASLFSACIKSEVEESTSRFMIVHAAPNTPSMEFYIDDKPIILLPLVFTSNIYYRDILSGIRNFKVNISGRTIIDTNMNFTKDDVRSIFLYDRPVDLKMKVVDDNLSAPLTSNCRVRFFQMIPDADSLDLINTYDNQVIFANTNLGDYKKWRELRAGIYNFQLRNTASQAPIYTDWRPDTLLPGKNYTIISNGFQSTLTDDTLDVWLISNGDF